MANALTKRSLSPARKRLVELLQRLNFGRIEGLQVRGGEPVLDPLPRIVREVKLAAAENGPRPEADNRDFLLKAQVVDLFGELDRLGTGTIELLEVKHGLPFRLFVAGSVP